MRKRVRMKCAAIAITIRTTKLSDRAIDPAADHEDGHTNTEYAQSRYAAHERNKVAGTNKPVKKYRESAKQNDRDQEHDLFLSPRDALHLPGHVSTRFYSRTPRAQRRQRRSFFHWSTLPGGQWIGLRDSAIVCFPGQKPRSREREDAHASLSESSDLLCAGPGPSAMPLTSDGRRPKCARNRLLKWEELLNPIAYAISVTD
jgi:hypothetical protein